MIGRIDLIGERKFVLFWNCPNTFLGNLEMGELLSDPSQCAWLGYRCTRSKEVVPIFFENGFFLYCCFG